MHHQLIEYACLLAVIVFIVMLAERIKIAYPILLLLAGLVLSFIPALRDVEIKPDMIFVIFLPPLLYEAAWNTSWKDFWRWRRLILSFAFIIVIMTSCVVAVVSHNLIPGFTLAAGFLLGGIVSPPDAVSASAILKNVRAPKRLRAILEGESLMNDASSLIVYRFALIAVLTGNFVFKEAAMSFVVVIVMGVAVGLGVALVFYAIHRWLPTNNNMDVVLSFLTPYVMYVTAESFEFSGVLAVVSGGLFLSYHREQIFDFRSRLQSVTVWQAAAFVLNGFVFILIGLELPVIIKNLGPEGLSSAIKYSAIICATLIIARMLSVYGAVLFTMLASHFITVADDRPGWRSPILFGWAGMRGVVSLAAALSIPVMAHKGQPFPQRDLILFITFSVILVTLVLQGLTLPALIKWVNMPDPDFNIPFEEQQQRVRKKLAVFSLALLQDRHADELAENAMLKAFKVRLETDVDTMAHWNDANDEQHAQQSAQKYREILEEVLLEQRKFLNMINKKDGINDDVIKYQLSLLDLEQEKIRRHFTFGEEA